MQKNTNIDKKIPVTIRVTGYILNIKVSNSGVVAGEAFADHMEIETVVFPESLQNIDELAFAGCNPQKVEYNGDALEEELVETRVSMNSLSQPPVKSKSPFNWILAGVLFLSGGGCIMHKVKL